MNEEENYKCYVCGTEKTQEEIKEDGLMIIDKTIQIKNSYQGLYDYLTEINKTYTIKTGCV